MSTDTVLNIIQSAAAEIGVVVGNSIVATDLTTRRLVQGLNRVGRSLRREAPWDALLKRYPFEVVDGQARYKVPEDWDGVVNSTAWNSSNRMYVYGTITPVEYEALINSCAPLTTLNSFYRFIGNTGDIEIIPTPTVREGDNANLLVLEYYSTNWLRPSAEWQANTLYDVGDTVTAGDNIYKCVFGGETGDTMPLKVTGDIIDGTVTWNAIAYDVATKDDDLVVLDRDLLQIALIMQFLDNKGFNYDKYAQMFEDMKATMIARTIGGRVDTTITPQGRRALRHGLWANKFKNMPYRI